MASVLAIISKKAFVKQMGESASAEVLPIAQYICKNKEGGDLYLVTVRPSRESL